MVDPNKKPGEKSPNLRAWERLLGHEVSALRVEWSGKRGSNQPVQACWVSGFIPDTFNQDRKKRWAPDLEMRGAEGEILATAKLQPKAAAASQVIPETPLVTHRGTPKQLPAARTYVWAVALGALPLDLQWILIDLTSDERFLLQHFRARAGAEMLHPGEVLDEHLRWEEREAERDRQAKAEAEAAAKAKAEAVGEAVEMLVAKGVTVFHEIPASAKEWIAQERARQILDDGDNEAEAILAAAALFQD